MASRAQFLPDVDPVAFLASLRVGRARDAPAKALPSPSCQID